MPSTIKLKGKKRALHVEPLPPPVDNEPPHPTKRVKRAETRICPVCEDSVPVRLLARHAELESERVDEILNKVGSSDFHYESDRDPGPSSRTRRSAIKARKSIVTRTKNSVEQTDKAIQVVKRHRKQRHAKLKEMTKDEEEGNLIHDSWVNRFSGNQIQCPVCSAMVRGDEEIVEAHVDACLVHETQRRDFQLRESQHHHVVEEALGDEDESFITYVGDLRGAGFHTRNRNEEDVDEDLDIEGDDQALYGEAQFTEGDIVPIHVVHENGDSDIEVNIEDSYEDETREALQTLHGLGSQSDVIAGKPMRTSAVLVDVSQRFGDNITSLPLRDIEDKLGSDSNVSPALLCRICLDPYSEPTVSTGCWHVCCRECWLRCLGSTKLCPICKRITCATDLRRIYL